MNTQSEHANRQSLVSFVKSEGKKTPEWQKNVALATNAAGVAAGPAAIYMAVRQARSKKGGMPRAVVEAAEAKSKPMTRTGRAARATGKVLRNPKAIAAGGAVAIGAQVANTSGDAIAARFIAEDKKRTKKEKVVNKSDSTKNPKSYKSAVAYLSPEQSENYKAGVHRLANKKGNRTAAVGGAAGAAAGGGTAAYLLRKGPKKVVVPTAIAAGALLGVEAGAAGRKSARNSVYNSRRVNGKRLDGKVVKQMAIEQSFMSKAETNPVTGMGMNLENVEKRYYDSEADRQRRLGAASGVLGGVAVVTGAEAARRVPLKGVGRAVRAGIKGNPRIAAGLAAASGLSGVGAAASYKRGISRRNMTWQ